MKVDLKKIAEDSKHRYTKELTGLKELEERGELLHKLRSYSNKVVSLPLQYLTVSENVRKDFQAEGPEFEELVASIRSNGLLQNLVASLVEHENGDWELRVTAGQRRYYACRQVGLEKVPVMIRIWNSEAEELYAGLSENLARVDLHPLHVADAYARLMELGLSVNEIAERVDRQKRTIRKYLALSQLPADIRQMIAEKKEVFTTGVLFNEIASRNFPNQAEMRAYLEALIHEKEAVVFPTPVNTPALGQVGTGEGKSGRSARRKAVVDPLLVEEVISTISNALPVKVRVKGTPQKGRITIQYASREQLDQLLAKFQSDNALSPVSSE